MVAKNKELINKNMKTKIYLSSILGLVLTYFNAMYAVDYVAEVFGYTFTIFILPVPLYFIALLLMNKFNWKNVFLKKNNYIHIIISFLIMYIPVFLIAFLLINSGEM